VVAWRCEWVRRREAIDQAHWGSVSEGEGWEVVSGVGSLVAEEIVEEKDVRGDLLLDNIYRVIRLKC
jgi:hypothetical protein